MMSTRMFQPRELKLLVMVQPPTVFYKDQARQSKFFTIIVVLVDEKNKIVNGLKVPLNIKVTYETGEEITNAKAKTPVFILNTKCNYEIGEDGFGELLIRLNQVTKNHNDKKFVVQIEADKKYLEGVSVEPSTSQPIDVRSKRNRNNRGNRKRKIEIDADKLKALASWSAYAYTTLKEISTFEEIFDDISFKKLRIALDGYQQSVYPLISLKYEDTPDPQSTPHRRKRQRRAAATSSSSSSTQVDRAPKIPRKHAPETNLSPSLDNCWHISDFQSSLSL
mmetsp:Transcript_23211/g.34754  ORF Transcript_23211/g.34754 Transcript_23211/m.34754 type:complete len:279 (-) Transcript_23211:209-1045(-)